MTEVGCTVDDCGDNTVDNDADEANDVPPAYNEFVFDDGSRHRPAYWSDDAVPCPETSMAQTGFDVTDAPVVDRDQYERMKTLNDGYGDADRSTNVYETGIQRDIAIICDRLGATEYQQQRVTWLIDKIPLKETVLKRGPIELAILGAATLVIDEERGSMTPPFAEDIPTSVMRDESFQSLLDSYGDGVRRTRVRTVRQRIRETDVYESVNNGRRHE